MRADAQANREKILEVARELFIERGTEVDVREICERAGIGMGTLYRHFPTKDDLIDAVTVDMGQDLQTVMNRFERRENRRPPLVEWLAFQEDWGEFGREVHARFARGVEPGDEAPAVAEPFEAMRHQRLGQWRALRAAKRVREDIPPEFLMEASDGLLAMYLDLRQRWEPEQTREWLASIFADGVRPRHENDRGSVEFPAV